MEFMISTTEFDFELATDTQTAAAAPRKLPIPKILAWSDSPEWDKDVANTANAFGSALCASITLLTAPAISLKDALAITSEDHYILTVIHAPERMRLTEILENTTTPLVLVRGHHIAVQQILVALRGIASDERMLDWIAPFVWWHGTDVALIPLSSSALIPASFVNSNYSSANPVERHLQRFLRRLETDGVQVNMCFRQGNLVSQVVDELGGETYDLLAIAAEGRGNFVGRILAELDRRDIHTERPVLIVKSANVMRRNEL